MCRVKGHPLSMVTSDAFSGEKRHHMAALGAELTVIPSVEGGMNEALTRHMIDAARQMAQRTGGFWTDQRHNPDQLSAYRAMGEELWRQTGGRVDACVQRVGTAASLRGVADTLRQHQADVQIVAVEPRESAVLSGEPTGVHTIEGVGAGFVVPLWEPSLVSEIARVSTEEAMAMVRRLAREEALCAGTSTGGNLVAALDIAKRLGPKATVVTVMVDAGMKYLSTPLYKNSQYMPCP
jgi:cysteine synthase